MNSTKTSSLLNWAKPRSTSTRTLTLVTRPTLLILRTRTSPMLSGFLLLWTSIETVAAEDLHAFVTLLPLPLVVPSLKKDSSPTKTYKTHTQAVLVPL
ncbi:hypothetical protein G6F24_018844 [Rhizopus arrhizus]|nr:hypothetical protein G6F24_018844 [Rhizopus arrhizus]